MVTAYQNLFQHTTITADQRVLNHAATGGVEIMHSFGLK